MADIFDAILANPKLIDTAKQIYELTFTSNYSGTDKKYKFKTNTYKRGSTTKHYFITVEHGRITEIDPAD